LRKCSIIARKSKTISSQFEESIESLDLNPASKHGVAMCILQIGELAGHLTNDFKEAHHIMPWSNMRNIAAHHYGKFSIQTLFETIKNDVPALKVFCEKIILKHKEAAELKPTSSPRFRP
jgi:uncharacterized protein with HEPN domain